MSTTPNVKPRRKRRRWLILVPVLLLAAVGLAMAVPDSPIYLAKLLEPEVSEGGRPRSSWVADLSSPDAETRTQAANALGRMNTAGRKALPELVRVMKSDPEAGVRASAADAAAKMYPANESDEERVKYAAAVLEAFTAGLTDPDLRMRYNSATGLLKLKEKARPAVSALLVACDDPANDTNLNIYHATIRQVMYRALGEAAAGTPDAVPVFTAILDVKVERPNMPRRGGQGQQVTKELDEASRKYSVDSVNRRIAVTGLGLAGEHGKGSATKIRELLTSRDSNDRFVAAEALQRMGLPAEEK